MASSRPIVAPSLTPTKQYLVHYDKIFQLFADPLTKCLRDRQANTLTRIVSANPNGIRLNELGRIIQVCDLALDAINHDQKSLDLFSPNLCTLIRLLSKNFVCEKGIEYHLYHDSLIQYLKWLWKAGSFRVEHGNCRQLNLCALDALRRYLNTDKVWQYPMPERFCQTLPVECRRWKTMHHLAESNFVEDIVKSVLDAVSNDPIQITRALLLRDLSMSPVTADIILSENSHVIPAMRVLLQTNRRELMVPLAIETIWNLFEQSNTLAALRLGQDFIVKSLCILLAGTLQPGSSLEDRCLRNQIICLLTLLSRVGNIGQAFIQSGLIDLLLKHSIELELGVFHSTSFQFEDVEMKKLCWEVIADLANNPGCIEIYASSPLISALLVHTDIESGPESMQILIDVDRHALALASFQLLSVLLPKLHRIFQRENGMRRMSRYLRYNQDRVAEIDRVAISVLLKGCQTQEDCQSVVEDICDIFTDSSRLPQVRSDLAVLLARCASLIDDVAVILRRTGAFTAAINWIEDIKSSVKLIASSLHIVKLGCIADENNLSLFFQRKGVDLVMNLLLSSPSKELQRASMTFLDDLAISSAGIFKQLVENHSDSDTGNNLMLSLLSVWRTECNTLKSGCIHGAIRSCYGKCQLLISEKERPAVAVSQRQFSTFSTLSRIVQRVSQLFPVTSPEDVFEVAMIIMYDEIRICNAWAECLQCHGPKGEKEQFLEFDLIPIRNRIHSLGNFIQIRINQAISDAAKARQVQEAKFEIFADTIRVLIDQRDHPPEQKIMAGASTLVASSRLRLSKEQKKDMCAMALQHDQTFKQILDDNRIFPLSGCGIVSPEDNARKAAVLQSEKDPDYIEDVVLGDPVLCKIWSALQTIQPESGLDFIP